MKFFTHGQRPPLEIVQLQQGTQDYDYDLKFHSDQSITINSLNKIEAETTTMGKSFILLLKVGSVGYLLLDYYRHDVSFWW